MKCLKLLVLMFFLMIISLSADELVEIKAQIIVDGVNLLSEPIDSSNNTGRVYLNSKAIVVSKTGWVDESYFWYFIRFSNKQGWIHGSNIILLATQDMIDLISIDQKFIIPIFKPYDLSNFIERPFNNKYKAPPIEINDISKIQNIYGEELVLSITTEQNRHDNNITDTFYDLSNEDIEITYIKIGNELYLIRYIIKSDYILNNNLVEISSYEDLRAIIGEPHSKSNYKGKDIYTYYENSGKQIQFYYQNNHFSEIVVWYYEG